MQLRDQLRELESLAKALDVKVSYDAMTGLVQGGGGLCKLKGRYRIIIDRRLKTPERLQIIADALAEFPLPESIELSPSVARRLAAAQPAQGAAKS